MNIASMSRSVLSVIVHVPGPEQPPPDQPPKREPAFGVAVIVVVAPSLPLSGRYELQLMPSGLVTRPDPEPVCVSMLRLRLRLRAKVAVTVLAALRETSHVSVPLQAPDQPVNDDPSAAAAVSFTVVPTSYTALQVTPQGMPAGALVTLPEPLPAFVTVSVGVAVKFAVALCATVSSTSQVPVPLQAPLQPVKRDPAAAAAVRVTLVPSSNVWLQVAPHAMPSGALVTVPVPLPVLATVSVFGPAAEELITEPVSSIATHKVVDTQSTAVRELPGMSAVRTAHELATVGCTEE